MDAISESCECALTSKLPMRQFRKKKIVIRGRLGNQLWQLAFAHHLIENGIDVELIDVQHDGVSSFNRNTLSDYLRSCTHGIGIVAKDFSNRSVRRLYASNSRLFGLGVRKGRIVDERDRKIDNFHISQIKKSEILVGQFQYPNILQRGIATVLKEMQRTTDEKYEDALKKFPSIMNRPVVHFRFGDYLQDRHFDDFGVLDQAYYIRIREKFEIDLGDSAVLLSDDPDSVKKYVPFLKNAHFLGPEEISEEEAISIMAKSKLLFASNSTFAWWGGMYSLKSGGRVIVPHPFHKAHLPASRFSSEVEAPFERLESSFF